MFTDVMDDAVVEVVVPVYNEQEVLAHSISELCAYLHRHLPLRWRVVIVDNASTDATWDLAQDLADTLPGVRALHLDQKGRGRALKAAWSGSTADVVAYMDVDLSTNLHSFLPLIAPLLSGHSQVAIGNRLMKGSRTTRQWKREALSRGYNLLILRADVARQLLPHVEDTGWFFDTELLLLADRAGHRIYEVPVDWIEDLDTRVHLPSTVSDDLKGLWRMRRAFWRGQPVIANPVRRVERPRVAA